MIEALSFPFFQRVLIAGLLASIACGVIGALIVAKRMSSVSGGLAHAAFGGVGLGYWAGFSPMLGATGFGILASIAIGVAYRRLQSGLDTVISMVWAVGMAIGILFVAFTPGYAPDLMSYLFGSLLFVPWSYVYLVAALDVLIVLAVWLLFKEFQAVSFDEEFAEVAGVPVDRMLYALLGLCALAIVTLIRVVGAILAIALLTIPAAVARHWTQTLQGMMCVAVGVAAVCTVLGLFLSHALSESLALSAPPGPLIVLSAAGIFGVSAIARSAKGRR